MLVLVLLVLVLPPTLPALCAEGALRWELRAARRCECGMVLPLARPPPPPWSCPWMRFWSFLKD